MATDDPREPEETGETTPAVSFVAMSAAASALEPASRAADGLNASQSPRTIETPTLDPPPQGGSRSAGYWAVRLVPVLVLLLVIGWAAVRISALITPRRPKEAPLQEQLVISAGNASTTGDVSDDFVEYEDTYDDDSDDPIGGEPLAGQSLGGLLRYRVERYDAATDTSEQTRLAEGPLRYGGVTIVNLWATWCEACKEEFPGFRRMLFAGQKQSGWGGDVRFVTLMIHDNYFAQEAYRKVKDLLPPDTDFLVDPKLDPIEEGLQERALLPDPVTLPVTFVLDCRRRVRWSHKGALTAAHFDELDREIRALRENLKTNKCRRKKIVKKKKVPVGKRPKKPMPTGQMRSACNRNGFCDEGETTKSCPKDCPPDPF